MVQSRNEKGKNVVLKIEAKTKNMVLINKSKY